VSVATTWHVRCNNTVVTWITHGPLESLYLEVHSPDTSQSSLVRGDIVSGVTRLAGISLCAIFYRAMHFGAKRGIAIACRLSVRLSVCL